MRMNPKLRGFVAQSMSGRKRTGVPSLIDIKETTTATTGTYTPTCSCIALIYAWGAGGGGVAFAGGGGAGGGGSAGFRRVRVNAGDTLTWSVGAGGAVGVAGDDTTVTVHGATLTAGGGFPGVTTVGGAGGFCRGPWDTLRTGGAGGNDGATGETPVGGGTGAAGSGDGGGGGGSAGFSDQTPSLPKGDGGLVNSGLAGSAPGGGGGGGAAAGGAGAVGRVLIYFVQVAD
jgi:hypothetical protein